MISVRVRSSSEPVGTHRDVGVDAQRPLLHLRVRDPELDDRLAQQLQEPLCLVGRADVRLGHDLHERRAPPVVVDERGIGAADSPGPSTDVDGLRRILLQVRPDDSDHTITVRSW